MDNQNQTKTGNFISIHFGNLDSMGEILLHTNLKVYSKLDMNNDMYLQGLTTKKTVVMATEIF